MHRHKDIRLLINTLTESEKVCFLQQPHSAFTPEHVTLLTSCSSLSNSETARQLGISGKRYKVICEKAYTGICRFLLLGKQAAYIDYELQDIYLLAELLKERGLFAYALEKLQPAIATAERYELYGREILLQHQFLQISSYTHPAADDVVLSIMQRIAWLTDEQATIERLHCIYDQLLTLRYKLALRTSPDEQQEIKQLENQLQIYLPETLRSNTSRIYYYLSELLIDFMLGNTESFHVYNASLLFCWQQQDHLIALHPELFIRSLSAQAYTHFLSKDITAAQTYLEQYRLLGHKHLLNPFYKHWFAIVDFHTTLKVLHKTYEYGQLALYFPAEWPKVYSNVRVLREAEKIDIIVSACITYFVLQQWQEAEELILDVKKTNYKIKRTDTLYFTFVFHCLILYEQKEWSRLNSLINTEYHFLYSNKTLRPFEKDMLLFIKKMPMMMLHGKSKEGMQAFLQKLDIYRKDDIQKLHFAYFNFYSWIESKAEGTHYTDHVKQKAMSKEAM